LKACRVKVTWLYKTAQCRVESDLASETALVDLKSTSISRMKSLGWRRPALRRSKMTMWRCDYLQSCGGNPRWKDERVIGWNKVISKFKEAASNDSGKTPRLNLAPSYSPLTLHVITVKTNPNRLKPREWIALMSWNIYPAQDAVHIRVARASF
jgi:hypothetical protein